MNRDRPMEKRKDELYRPWRCVKRGVVVDTTPWLLPKPRSGRAEYFFILNHRMKHSKRRASSSPVRKAASATRLARGWKGRYRKVYVRSEPDVHVIGD